MPRTAPPPHALLVGWKPLAIDALRAEDCSVTCVVSATDAERARGAAGAEILVAGEAGSVEDVLFALARAGLCPGDFDLVTSGQEYSLTTAAALGVLGGVRAMPLDTAVALRDKYVQKRRISAAGIETARCGIAATPRDVASAARHAGGFPVVVKPQAGAGARNTVRLASQAEADRWAASAGQGPWLVEEFVPGAELHLDGVVRDGRTLVLSASRYLRNVIDVHSGALVGSVRVTPEEEPGLYSRAGALTDRALAALGHADGVFHLEVFEQPDGSLVFGECGGRVGGGRVDEVTRRATGADLHRHWAAAALGTTPPAAGTPSDASLGWVFLTAPAGRVVSIPGEEQLLGRRGVVAAAVTKAPGDLVGPVVKSFDRAGDIVAVGQDAAEVRARLADCAEWFRSGVTVTV
ncbi:ATP-grasp domain-containing protein [Streptomyces sp. NPDC007808]|uniref:ATP-grasp domain-containing protein n=1 Tax=Streptomyces sp. NPDC007808 TaxID=3364779 RepID=UPI0036CCBD60